MLCLLQFAIEAVLHTQTLFILLLNVEFVIGVEMSRDADPLRCSSLLDSCGGRQL